MLVTGHGLWLCLFYNKFGTKIFKLYDRIGKREKEGVRMEKEMIIRNGKTEITINEQAISVSAPKIEIESTQESDKSNHQS